MSKDLLVQMEIPISPRGDRDFPGPTITFNRWLPLEEDDFITIREENMLLTLCFTMDSWQTVTDRYEEDLPNTMNIDVHKIFVDVKIEDVSDGLADFIVSTDYYRRPKDEHTSEEKRLISEYERLGNQVYVFTLKCVNRLLSYVRSEKGQYWLVDHPVDPDRIASAFTLFRAKVKTEDTRWNLWQPTQTETIHAEIPDTSRFISRNDWKKLREFITSEKRIDFILELLARAEYLAKSGYHRSALTEAVTALEVALSRFSQHPKAKSLFNSQFAPRVDLSDLNKHCNELGLRKTVRYLLPLMFSEDQLPAQIVKGCQDAIAQRNQVIHHGQKKVDKNNLNVFLSAIRTMCSTLNKYSDD